MRTARSLLAQAATLAGLLTGCQIPGAGPGSEAAEAELLDQEDAAVTAAGALFAALDRGVGLDQDQPFGDITAKWDGCAEAFPEQYRDFRYESSTTLELAPGAPETLTPFLVRAATEAGWTVTEVGRRAPGFPEEVVARKGALTAVLRDVLPSSDPAAGDVRIVLAVDPCVEVPADEREDWLTRDPVPPALP